MATYFITETYIKTNSPITENMDPKDLYPHIESAQSMYMKNILGSDFYNDIYTKYVAQTLNANEEILVLTYMKPAILWRAIALALPWIQFNLRNKGLMVNSDDNATPAGTAELKFMMATVNGRADFQEEELRKYLCENGELYSAYQSQTGLTKPDTSSNWDHGFIFDKNSYKDRDSGYGYFGACGCGCYD